MKKLALAAAFTFLPTASQAAVTISFTGATFPYVSNDDRGGSYIEQGTSADTTFTVDTAAQAVAGTITINTSLAGPNTGVGDNVSYAGESPFITLTYASSGVTPVKLNGSLSDHSVGSAGLEGITFNLFDEADTYAYSFRLLSLSPIPTSIFDGLLLPDFTKASDLFFSAVSLESADAGYIQRVSFGSVNTIKQVASAVPEPSTWTMMLAGFGLMAAGLRQRRRATVCFA